MGDRSALEAELEYIKQLPGFERTNPQFFSDPMIDKLLEIALLLGGEIWTNRDRHMVMEHLLATEGMVTPDRIETFSDESFKEESEKQRLQFVQRIFGCLYDGIEVPEDGNHFRWLTDKQDGQDTTAT
jgi:hypothetical protein